MIRLIRKISAVILACLLGLNLATAAILAVSPCPLSMCYSGPMDIDQCDGLLNFALSIQECCAECNDIFCDLMRNHFQDADAANPPLFQESDCPFFPGAVDFIGESGAQISFCEPRHLLYATHAMSHIPLYIEYHSLIIWNRHGFPLNFGVSCKVFARTGHRIRLYPISFFEVEVFRNENNQMDRIKQNRSFCPPTDIGYYGSFRIRIYLEWR